MPPKKRASATSIAGPASKRPRAAVSVGASRGTKSIHADTIISTSAKASEAGSSNKSASDYVSGDEYQQLKEKFLSLFESLNNANGLSNTIIKQKLGPQKYLQLAPIINELMKCSKLVMSKVGDELFYNVVSDEMASKFAGLDVSARMVYQVIEKAGNMGIWTKDVRTQTNIQQQTLNKIFKSLEQRQLIKPVKSVTAKAKKLYMLYELTPAKELTGGPWYTELEFDHEFISELRTFIMLCVKRMNGGKGVTVGDIAEKMNQANVSRVKLNYEEIHQLMQTLAYDYMIEPGSVNSAGDQLFVAARRVTSMCDFSWWEVLSPDFHFRAIKFDDGVILPAHEPHHHT